MENHRVIYTIYTFNVLTKSSAHAINGQAFQSRSKLQKEIEIWKLSNKHVMKPKLVNDGPRATYLSYKPH